jgi:hypothetical protein
MQIHIGQLAQGHFASGYLNATAMCKANGKKFHDWYQNQFAKDLVEELSIRTGIPVPVLVQIQNGGNTQETGTWIHLHVAI